MTSPSVYSVRLHAQREPRLLTLLPWFVAGLAFAAEATAHLVNKFLLDGEYGALDAAADHTPFAWMSVGAAAIASLAAGRAALDGRTWQRLALAAVLGFLAVDDAFGLHEAVAGDLDPDLLAGASWTAAGLVGFALLLGAAFVILLREFAGGGATRAAVLLRGSLSLFALALGARALGGALELGSTLPDRLVDLGVAFEQSGDLAGWILLAWGLAALRRA